MCTIREAHPRVDLITTHIQQRPTTHRWVEPVVVGHRRLESKLRVDADDSANFSRCNDLGNSCESRVPTAPHGFNQRLLTTLGARHHLLHFCRPQAEWFLTQHVLAGLERLRHPFEMLMIRQADVHGVNLRVVEQLLIRVVDLDWLEFL